jgi:hypothetical protein
MEIAAEPGSAGGPEVAQEKPAPMTPTKRAQRKRGSRADLLRAPPGYIKRLVEELGAEALARQEARKVAQAHPSYVPPPEPRRPRRHATEAQAFAEMLMTPSQKRRRRTEELRREREKNAAEGAALLAFVQERKAARAEAEKRVAERKAQGAKPSFEQWREEVSGEQRAPYYLVMPSA